MRSLLAVCLLPYALTLPAEQFETSDVSEGKESNGGKLVPRSQVRPHLLITLLAITYVAAITVPRLLRGRHCGA